MEIKIDCACGKLTYELPETVAAWLSQMSEEERKAVLAVTEDAFHYITQVVFGLGPLGLIGATVAIKRAMAPYVGMVRGKLAGARPAAALSIGSLPPGTEVMEL